MVLPADAPQADVLIVTATPVESKAVMAAFEALTGQRNQQVSTDGRVYRDLGEAGGTRVFLALTEMGSGGLGASQQAVHKGIDALRPGAVLLVGIAFGADDKKQRIGDILVSQQLQLYELQRVSPDRLISRGDKPHASPRLIDYFRHAALEWDESMAPVDFGLLLSGEKLVDDLDYRKQLQQFGPEAIGGEMEGAGLYVACQDAKVDWIVIKAICDWADGHKKRNKTARQQLAAGNAAAFVAHALQQAPLKRPESPMEQPPTTINNTGSGAVAAGARGVAVRGNHTGAINTGWQIVNHYYDASDRRLSKEQIAQQVAGYLRWLQARTENIELRGIERAGGAPVVLLPLETAYVPLRAKWMRGDTDIALNKVLGSGNRLVIVGGPGSGKTTVLLHMAWALASSLLNRQSEPARSRLGPLMKPSERDEQGKPKKPQEYQPRELPLPLFVPLASFARYRRHLAVNAPARERTLAHFISYHLIDQQADFDLPADFFVQLFKDGQDILLLLDGLDEVANENERAEVRQSVEKLVHGRTALRVVLTCRTIAYRSGRTALGADFREIAVQPLNFDQHIVPMVRQAYACIYPLDAALRTERANDLLEGIQGLEAQRRARLGRQAEAFVDSPLMVRLLLIVHFNNRRLPDERAELFDKAINALLQVDYSPDVSVSNHLAENWKRYRDMAQQLAFHLHQQGRDQGREIEELALKAALRQDQAFEPYIDDFLSQARQRGSVLEERDGAYRFIHLALQEFLVARYLREVIGAEGRAAILAFLDDRLDDPWWREPILLLVGYMATNTAKSARDFLSALARAGSRPNAKFAAIELAGTAALEWRDGGESARVDCAQHIVTLLSDSEASATFEPILRARTGDLLARWGDSRFDAEHWYLPAEPLFGFIEIPVGSFMMGSDQRRDKLAMEDRECPQHEVNLPSYYLAHWPVTVAQFAAFMNESSFQPQDPNCLRGIANHPVVRVSWHEAMAYCRWLNERLRELARERLDAENLLSESERRFWRGLADGSLGIGLPSEAEWEKGARGTDGRIYPWEDEADPNLANHNVTGLNGTSTVGCFPGGASPYGCEDLSGNVWEWTRSLFGDYPYPPEGTKRQAREDPAATGPRVLRGGAFLDGAWYARCACRDDGMPGYRYDYYGFRVVASPLVCSDR
jgi:formylglycine-generating enzyme required for sulfatase activity/nucleoside phosphorylase